MMVLPKKRSIWCVDHRNTDDTHRYTNANIPWWTRNYHASTVSYAESFLDNILDYITTLIIILLL